MLDFPELEKFQREAMVENATSQTPAGKYST